MKKTSICAVAAAFVGLSSAQAGSPGYVPMAKGPVPPPLNVPSLCDCFNPNTTCASFYAAGLISDGGEDLDDSIGGGIALDYYFTEHVGVQADATWLAESSVVHLFTASVVVRAPIKSACLAPYLLAGGGAHVDSVNQAVFHAGGGLDVRFANCWGLFADARYTWADKTEDYVIVRGGVRFNF